MMGGDKKADQAADAQELDRQCDDSGSGHLCEPATAAVRTAQAIEGVADTEFGRMVVEGDRLAGRYRPNGDHGSMGYVDPAGELATVGGLRQ
jgi:hypothetical protein